MTVQTPMAAAAAARRAPERSLLPLMTLLLAASGAAALVYEIVWFQLLELVIGSSAVSLGVLLGTFMGGMCLGSLLLPRLVPARHHPLRVYAAIEAGIGIVGILVLFVMPLVGRIYTHWSGYDSPGFMLRGLVAAACLLPPTLLMGATLPVLARRVGVTPWGASAIGLLYGGNIVGAVLGTLLAAFYLLREYDVATATFAAAAVNAAAAAVAVVAAAATRRHHPDERGSGEPAAGGSVPGGSTPDATSDAIVYVVIGASGFCALAAQTIWTRLLGLLLGASVYGFAIILAVFLVGLGVGSGLGSLLCKSLVRPRAALGWCQLLAAAAIAWTAYSLAASLPYWPINPSISSNIWFTFQLDLDRAFWALLPPTVLWGASFPLAVAALERGQDPGRLVSNVYAANTLGAIVGAIGASLLLIAWVGSQRSEQLLIAASTTAGLLLFLPVSRSEASGSRWAGAGLFASAAVVAAALVLSVPPVAKLLIAHGRYAATWVGKGDIVYAAEGLSSSVAVSRFPNGVVTYHVAGKIQASSVPRDMRLQRMLGHLTTLTAATPRRVAVIGCGAGITAGAVSIDPRVQHVTIVEIEPLVPHVASTYFSDYNFDVLHNPKVDVRIDDGRHFVLTTRERFDAITSDPLDPWVKGAASLYTREFLEAAKQRLNPGGVVTLYLQLFETNAETVKSALATFLEVFPNGTIWGNTYQGQGHDVVLLGRVEPLRIDLDDLDRRLSRPEYALMARSLSEVGMRSAVDLFATYAGRRSDLTWWLRNAAINRDRNLRLEYLGGFGLNLDDSAGIYADMISRRRFPEDIFTSSEWRVRALRQAVQRAEP